MRTPRRVLITADAVGGVWTYALDLAAGLAARGVGTVLAALGPAPDARQRAAAEAVPDLVLRHLPVPLDWLAETEGRVHVAAEAVATLAAKSAIDLVHLNSPALAALARFPVPVVTVSHSCLATWWQAVRQGTMPPDFAWRAALHGRGLATAAAAVAPSAAFAAATQAAYRLLRRPLVVYNGRAPAGLNLDARPADLVFTAGRLWDEGKDLAALDRAAAALALPVVAAGPTLGPNGARIALPHLRLPGRLAGSEVARILARRPVFASMAVYEPFGLAVLEAAQAGCALVLADTPVFRELWDGAALFVPPGKDGALAVLLGGLMADRQRRAGLGAAASIRAQRFSVEAMTTAMLGVYRRAMAAGEEIAA